MKYIFMVMRDEWWVLYDEVSLRIAQNTLHNKEVQYTMKLDELRPADGSKTTKKRIGRGIGSGLGKTSGKGHKGQNARSGGGVRPGFEGGQMPLFRRIPKRGFKNINSKEFTEVTLTMLEKLDNETEVTVDSLIEAGIIKKANDGIVVLGNGDLTKKLTVKAARVTKSAEAKILAAGGKVEVV